jgi:hypothetical protein
MDSSLRILLISDRKLFANSVEVPGEGVVSSRAEVTWGCLRVTLETLALPLPLLLEIPFSLPQKLRSLSYCSLPTTAGAIEAAPAIRSAQGACDLVVVASALAELISDCYLLLLSLSA